MKVHNVLTAWVPSLGMMRSQHDELLNRHNDMRVWCHWKIMRSSVKLTWWHHIMRSLNKTKSINNFTWWQIDLRSLNKIGQQTSLQVKMMTKGTDAMVSWEQEVVIKVDTLTSKHDVIKQNEVNRQVDKTTSRHTKKTFWCRSRGGCSWLPV